MSLRFSALLCGFGFLALAACGAPQSGVGQAECIAPTTARAPGAIEQDAACWLTRDDHALAAEACRQASGVASRLSATAASDVAVCVLRARERADGAWFSSFLSSLAEGERLAAAIAGADAFELNLHANSFTAAIDESVQRTLADGLDEMPASARELYVSLAMRYELATLLADVGPYVRELDADDPGLMGYAAARSDSGEALSEDDRWAAAASGYWTAEQVFACYERELDGCDSWAGTSPLELMDEPNVRPARQTDPQRASEIIGQGDVSSDEAEALTRFVTQSEYPNRGTMVNMLMLQLTDPAVSDRVRHGIARGSSAEMCAMGIIVETMMRARADEGVLDDPAKPWPTFLRLCHERYWEAEELGPAVASGSRLGSPQADWYTFANAFAEATSELACDDALQMAESSMDMVGNRAPQRGLVLVALSESTGSRCDETFAPAIELLSNDDAAHPEARLAGIGWRFERGDRGGCSGIAEAMAWYDEDLREGPSAWSEARADELRADCR